MTQKLRAPQYQSLYSQPAIFFHASSLPDNIPQSARQLRAGLVVSVFNGQDESSKVHHAVRVHFYVQDPAPRLVRVLHEIIRLALPHVNIQEDSMCVYDIQCIHAKVERLSKRLGILSVLSYPVLKYRILYMLVVCLI